MLQKKTSSSKGKIKKSVQASLPVKTTKSVKAKLVSLRGGGKFKMDIAANRSMDANTMANAGLLHNNAILQKLNI